MRPAEAGAADPTVLERSQSAAAAGPAGFSALLLGLGALAWLTSVGWTDLSLTHAATPRTAGALALVPLCLGVAANRIRRSQLGLWSARWLLLAAYPSALGLALALHPQAQLEQALGALPSSVAAITLMAYLAAALLSLQPARANLFDVIRSSPLLDEPARARREPARKRVLRAGLIGSCFAGALAIALIAPTLSSAAARSAWGNAADAGAVLCAVVASALAVSVVALFLGSALRRADAEPTPSPSERRTRVASLLFAALLGAVVYYTLSP